MKFLFLLVCLTQSFFIFAQPKYKKAPIETVKSIYDNYLHSEHHNESEKDKKEMRIALSELKGSAKEKDLPLLIEVWLYYDVVDFFTQREIEPIFLKQKKATLKAIDYRIKNKKKWEKSDTLPFSEIFELRKKLET
jgi:hypothetical protein